MRLWVRSVVPQIGKLSRQSRGSACLCAGVADSDEIAHQFPPKFPLDITDEEHSGGFWGGFRQGGASINVKTLPQVCAIKALVSRVMQNLFSSGLEYRRPKVSLKRSLSATHQPTIWRVELRDNRQDSELEYASRIVDFLKRIRIGNRFVDL